MEEDLEETLAGSLIQGAYRLRWATKTGAWLTVQKSTVNGTELGAQEWRDYLFLRYSLDPPDLPHYCNGCKPTFSICHALDCKRGRLVMARNNKIRDGVADLARKAFTPSYVRNDPLIFICCAMKRPKAKPAIYKTTTVPADTPPLEATEQKGDIMIRDLRKNGTDSFHNMHVVNTYPKSHLAKTP